MDTCNENFDRLMKTAVDALQSTMDTLKTTERNQYRIYKLLVLQALHNCFGRSNFMKAYIPEGTLPDDLYTRIDHRSRLDSLFHACNEHQNVQGRERRA